MRSYSLSGEPGASYYRVSIKREAHGAAGAYVDDELRVGDIVHASAARGNFTLRPGDTPVVLLSAGIGVTPVLAMLHALAAEASTREIWWLHGTRNGREHPFAEETRGLLNALAHHHSYICYSSPDREDRPNVDFDAPGRLNMRVASGTQLTAQWRFLYLRTLHLHERSDCRAYRPWASRRDRIHTETFGAGPSITPGIAASPRRPPHFASRCSRLRTDGFVCPFRSQCPLGVIVPELARAGRGLRRTCAVCVSNRRLPHLRDRACGRDDRLPPGPGRRTGGRQCADLLRATRRRRRDRFVTACGPLTARPKLWRTSNAIRHGARSHFPRL